MSGKALRAARKKRQGKEKGKTASQVSINVKLGFDPGTLYRVPGWDVHLRALFLYR